MYPRSIGGTRRSRGLSLNDKHFRLEKRAGNEVPARNFFHRVLINCVMEIVLRRGKYIVDKGEHAFRFAGFVRGFIVETFVGPIQEESKVVESCTEKMAKLGHRSDLDEVILIREGYTEDDLLYRKSDI